MPEDSVHKKVSYEIQGDNTGLIRTIEGALKKLDALDTKLSRVASKKDLSVIADGATRDAVARIGSITKALGSLEKMRNIIETANTAALTPAQTAVLKTVTAELDTLAKSLGTAANAGRVTQEQLNQVTATTTQLGRVVKSAGIETINIKKAEVEATKQAAAESEAEAQAQIQREKEMAEQTRKSTAERISALKILRTAYLSVTSVMRRVISYAADWLSENADFGETMNKFNVVVGESSEELGNFADQMSDAFGLDRKDTYEAVASFSSIAKSIDLPREKAELFSKTLTQLSADLSSLYNTSTEQALEALKSGLYGQLKPLKSYNIYLYQANLEQAALNHGINKSVEDMTEMEKICLRYVSILDQSAVAQGDLARTLSSTSNQLKITKNQIAQLKRSLGQIVTVIATTVLPAVNAIIGGLVKLFTSIAKGMGYEIENFASAFDDSTDSVEGTEDAVDALQNTVSGLSSLDEINLIGDTTTTDPLAGIDSSILDALQSYDNGMSQMENKFSDMAEKFGKMIQDTFVGDLVELFARSMVAIGQAMNFMFEHWETFEPMLKTLINLLTIIVGLSVAKTIMGWGSSIAKVVKTLPVFASGLKTVATNAKGFIDISGKGTAATNGWTIAFGALALAATNAITSSFLSQFEGRTKKIVAAITLAVAALTVATAAWMAYHGTMTVGVAVPVIMGAVGAGIAGVKALIPAMATGGVVDQPTVAMIGEGRYKEAVVPLGNSPQFATMKSDIADEVIRKISRTPTNTYGATSVGGNRGTVVLNVNGRELARALLPDLSIVRPQTGVKLS